MVEKQGVLLLGHGSRLESANECLFELAELVQGYLRTRVFPVFFQFRQPSLEEGVSQLIKEGIKKIIIVPVFLFPGVHVNEDLPQAIARLHAKLKGEIQLHITPVLGPDPRIAEILAEKVYAAGGFVDSGESFADDYLLDPREIVAQSRKLVEQAIGYKTLKEKFSDNQGEIVRRVVHSTGDVVTASLLRFHPQAVDVGIAALSQGTVLFCDVEMVKAGINRVALEELGVKAVCYSHHPEVKIMAQKNNVTRALMAVRLFCDQFQDKVIVIGNSPTALVELLQQSEQGIKPKLIIGVPVGFVGAAEIKARLANQSVPYITMLGPRGGSSVAVAIVNALLALARGQAGL
ncbi:MAG: precorrin-8X methylmutase [Syntrophomonadaceae bacterium]|nr:precorrin-8X methylmutase [Syntrophomonadaceae bacterium]